MRRTNRLLAAVSISALFAGAFVLSPLTASGDDAVPSPGPTSTEGAPALSGPEATATRCDIKGTAGNDVLEGKDKGEVICGMGGKDTIHGNGGPDVIRGGPGSDTLLGGAGDDDLLGGEQEDTCKQHKGRGALNSCEWPNPIEVCPVKNGTVYNDFGAPRAGHTHQGNDILAKRGEPVLATMSGKAEKAYYSGAGYTVILTGERGFTYNMHLLKSGRTEGRVKKGDVIGKVGSTGNAGSTNHLHFEWHFRGKGAYYDWPAVDPFPYLKKVCDRTASMPSGAEEHTHDHEGEDAVVHDPYLDLATASEELL